MTNILERNSAFSYQCHACGRCCHSKRIQTNPYELLRLSRNRGMSTNEFAHRYLELEGPYLRVRYDGSCVFLNNKGCIVHADRPLACRTYPLGRWVSGEGVETFRELKPHPQTEGEYGREGTVGQFLAEQDVYPYLYAADQYQALFYRLFEALQQALPMDGRLAEEAPAAMYATDAQDIPAFMEWLDVDLTVERYCEEHGIAVPREIDETINLHIRAIDEWLEKFGGGQ